MMDIVTSMGQHGFPGQESGSMSSEKLGRSDPEKEAGHPFLRAKGQETERERSGSNAKKTVHIKIERREKDEEETEDNWRQSFDRTGLSSPSFLNVFRRSDAVSPKAADILDKVMSQDAAGQQPQQHHHHFHPNLSNLPDLRSSSSPHQHQPLTLSTSVPAPSPYEHHQHFLSARHNMVTSVSLPKDSTTETGRHYSSLQSDLNDSIDKSMEDESEDDYDDDFSQGGHLKSPGQTSQEESSYSSSRLNFDPSPTPDKGSEKKNRESPEILSPISKRFFPEPSQNAPFGAHFVQMHSEFGRMVYPCDPLSCSSIGNSRNTTTVTYTSSYTGRGDNPAHQPYPLDHSDRKAIPKSSPTDGHRGLFSFPQNLQHGRADNSQQHSTFSRSFSPTKEQECVPNLAHTDRGSDPNSSDLSRGTLLKYPLPPGSMGMFPGLRGGMGVGNDMPPHVGDALMSPSAGLLPPPVRPPYLGHGMSQCMSAERQKHVFFCHLCSYSGAVKEDFDAHMGTHFEYNCPHCDYTSRTEGRLKRHIKDFHTDPENKHRSMPGRPKVYRCKQCEFSCIDKIVFWAHARTHIKEDKLLQCPRCPFVTEYKHHLEYHLRNHFGSKPFKCGKCNYSCVNKSMLNSHMKSHTNVYQYRCADCTYATKYCHSLKLHLRKYNHKPATVLNNDGSLPQGIDAELSGLSLLAKRGPPRGPRGLRKEKDRNAGSEPFIPGMFPMPPNPHHPMNSMINGVIMAAAQAAQYWPLLPNGMHPPPPLISMGGTNGQDPPFLPGFMKMNRLPPPELHKDGEVFDVRDSRSELKCKMCDFFCQSVDVLDAHTQKVHKGENRDLGNLMPFKQLPDQSAEEMAQRQLTRRTSAPPCAPMPAASPNTTLSDTYPRRYSVSDTTGASFQSQRETASNQFKVSPGSWSHYAARMNKINEEEYSRDYMNNFYIGERLKSDKECEERHKPEPPLEGADILRQMTLKFGNSPGSPPPPTLSLPPPSLDQSHAGSTLAPQQPDLQQSVKESPLDLTNKPKSVSPQHSQSPSPPALTLSGLCPSSGPTAVIPSTKRTHPETTLNSSEENSCSGDIPVASPRKRSRKGKAYKLETLCLKLQEKQVPSPYQSESEDSDQADLQNHSAVECANQLEDLERSEDKSSSHVEVHSSEARAKKTVGREEIQNEKEENRRSGPPIVDSEFEQLQQNLRILNNDLHPNESSPTGNECPLPHTGSSNSEVSRAETDTQKQDFKSALPSSIHEPPVINEPILQSPEDPEKETASLITAIYHHRRKPVTPALRRGAELAWKILNHPASGLPTANNKPSQCQQNDGSTDAPPPSHRNGFTNGSSNSYFTLTSLSPALNGVGNGAALAGARSLERQSTHAQTYNPLPLMTTEESSVQVTPSSKTDFYECSYCEISFRDCIMYTIHMGYHGYQNPYKCNMCGQTSKDKVEFFLHIARAAHN